MAASPTNTRPVVSHRGGTAFVDRSLPLTRKRLLWISALLAGWFLLAYFLPRLVHLSPADYAAGWLVPDISSAVATVGALGFFHLLYTGRISTRRLVEAALVLQVAAALALSIAELWTFYAPAHLEVHRHVHGVTWSCVLFTVFPALVPASLGRTVAATVASALMAPIVLMLSESTHGPALPDSVLDANLLALMAANTVAAVAALAASRGLRVLSRPVSDARPVGSYDLIEKLGEGGMGEVWRAHHRLLARPAAVKLIRDERLSNVTGGPPENVLRRFEREAQAIAKLQCPNSIQLYDFGVTEDGTFFYVMELLEGFDLDTLVVRWGPQPPERVVHLIRQACASLDEAHERGLLHRDIKPENLFCCRYGLQHDFLKVLDFGLVKAFNEAAGGDLTTLTQEGMVAGTVSFIAPEALLGETRLDARADLYSLGCVMFWLLTGQLVFDAPNPTELALMHVEKRAVAPSHLSPHAIPKMLDRLVLDLLAKTPAERPASAAEVMARLDECGIEKPWTQMRARAWWLEHVPPK